MTVDPQDVLAGVDLFANASSEALNQLVGLRGPVTYGPGDEIVEQGADDPRLHVVLDGQMRVSINDVDRAFVYQGGYIGELSLIDPAPRSARVVAGPQGATALVFTPDDLEPLMANNDFVRGINKALVARLREQEFTDISWQAVAWRPPAIHIDG